MVLDAFVTTKQQQLTTAQHQPVSHSSRTTLHFWRNWLTASSFEGFSPFSPLAFHTSMYIFLSFSNIVNLRPEIAHSRGQSITQHTRIIIIAVVIAVAILISLIMLLPVGTTHNKQLRHKAQTHDPAASNTQNHNS
jgi:hypothetical protein